MSYTLDNIPQSSNNLHVYFDIGIDGKIIGRIKIKLFRDSFPAGVENFIRLASGETLRHNKMGNGKYGYYQRIVRSYDNTKFYKNIHNNYIIGGDIYQNNGKSAGTIYSDEPIPKLLGDYFYPHETKGLVSLVPFKDDETGMNMYDSTFMITLDSKRPNNTIASLDNDQIVIGHVYQGMDILDIINKAIIPQAGKKYPEITIMKSGTFSSGRYLNTEINYDKSD